MDKPQTPYKYRDFRFVLIITYGHTFASIAITNGADVASVSEKLGHCDKAVTLQMYTHATRQMQDDAAEKMGSFMAQVM